VLVTQPRHHGIENMLCSIVGEQAITEFGPNPTFAPSGATQLKSS